MRLSILIPAYHEERTIAAVLRRVAAADTPGFAKEIIVCDDGSADGTAREVRAAAVPGVKLVQHARNRGKGAAIRSALEHATRDYTLIQDADLEYYVADYPAILAALTGGAEVVYGSRFLTRRRPHGMHAANYVANRILTGAANLLYGAAITDEATCFKAFRTDVLRSLDLECEGFEFCPEVTAKLGKRRIPIVEVPIGYQGRDVANGKKVRWTDGVEALWVLVRERVRR